MKILLPPSMKTLLLVAAAVISLYNIYTYIKLGIKFYPPHDQNSPKSPTVHNHAHTTDPILRECLSQMITD